MTSTEPRIPCRGLRKDGFPCTRRATWVSSSPHTNSWVFISCGHHRPDTGAHRRIDDTLAASDEVAAYVEACAHEQSWLAGTPTSLTWRGVLKARNDALRALWTRLNKETDR